MIYIAYDFKENPIGIVNAKSKELALAFWQGRDLIPNYVKSLNDFIDLDVHPTGVYSILNTETIAMSEFGKSSKEYVVVKR